MKAKTARRRLTRLAWRIAEAKIGGTKPRFLKKVFHREITALKTDQRNPASARVYQCFIYLMR